jgi:hypothetical protein
MVTNAAWHVCSELLTVSVSTIPFETAPIAGSLHTQNVLANLSLVHTVVPRHKLHEHF